MTEENALHLCYNCIKTKVLWDQLKDFISDKTLFLPSLTLQSAILGHIDLSDDYLINHIIHIYKIYIYNSRNRGYLNIEHLTAIIGKTKKIEEEISKHELKKESKYLVKWRPFTDELV